jgi:hypothetical protein
MSTTYNGSSNDNTQNTQLIAQQYTNLMMPVIQQGETRTAESTMLKTGLTVRDVQVIDYIKKLTVRTVNDLQGIRATVADAAEFESRWLPAPHLVEHCLQKSAQFDLLTLVSEESAVREAQTMAFKTHMDVEFVTAAMGNAIKNLVNVAEVTTPGSEAPQGITSPYAFVALPAGNTVTPAASTTFTEALDEVLDLLNKKDVDLTANPVICYTTSDAEKLLFQDPRYDNWNNMGTQVLASGALAPYRGIKFVHLSDTDVWNNGTKCLVVAGKPVCVGIWNDLSTKIDILPEHSYAKQIYTSMSMAAARLDEDRVFVIDIQNID